MPRLKGVENSSCDKPCLCVTIAIDIICCPTMGVLGNGQQQVCGGHDNGHATKLGTPQPPIAGSGRDLPPAGLGTSLYSQEWSAEEWTVDSLWILLLQRLGLEGHDKMAIDNMLMLAQPMITLDWSNFHLVLNAMLSHCLCCQSVSAQ